MNILSGEINGTGAISARENGSRRSTRAGACQQKGFKGHVATDGSLLENAGKLVSTWLGSGTVGLR